MSHVLAIAIIIAHAMGGSGVDSTSHSAITVATPKTAGKTRTYFIAADTITWTMCPAAVTKLPVNRSWTRPSSPRPRRSRYRRATRRFSIAGTRTAASEPPSHGHRSGSISAFWDPSFTRWSVTPFAWSFATTRVDPSACTRTACSTRRAPKVFRTMTERRRVTSATTPCRRVALTHTSASPCTRGTGPTRWQLGHVDVSLAHQ